MKIPAQVFAEVYAKDLPVGSVLKFRGSWGLLVGYEDSKPAALLMLGGDHAGQIVRLIHGMPRCIAVVAPFTWFPAVDEGAEPASVDHQTTTLALTSSGPLIVGADMDSFDHECRAFHANGLCDRKYSSHARRYVQWSAELAHQNEPYKSLGQLFSVVFSDEARR